MKFKSHTTELKYIIAVILSGGLILWLGIRLNLLDLNFIPYQFILLVSLILTILVYFYFGLTNSDFVLTDKYLEISNRFPLLKNKKSIELKDIKKVEFRDDSIINMFCEYKYLLIYIRDKESENKRIKIYCHGLEYDNNGENTNLPTFDDLYLKLREIGIVTEYIIKN